MQNIMTYIQTFAIEYGLNILGAILILILGQWASRVGSQLGRKILVKAKVNESLIPFLVSLLQYGILIVAIMAALERVGVQTTSLVALVGAAGLAIGLALEGALSNFAAGFLLLFFRPFKVGDLVEAGGAFGYVEEIQIFSTIIVTLDNKTVIIPNSQITGANIVNYSKKGKIRLDMVFGIGYGDDLLKAKRVLQEILAADKRVLEEPAPTVAVLELGDSSVNFAVRPYVKIEDYWGVFFDTHEMVKLQFDSEGISIPFPQRDVHLFQQS